MTIDELKEDIIRREKGRLALIDALIDIYWSKTIKEAVDRARKQLSDAGVNPKTGPQHSEYPWDPDDD